MSRVGFYDYLVTSGGCFFFFFSNIFRVFFSVSECVGQWEQGRKGNEVYAYCSSAFDFADLCTNVVFAMHYVDVFFNGIFLFRLIVGAEAVFTN